MKKFTLFLCCMLFSIAICSSNVYAFIFDITEFEQHDGSDTFTDTFSDGIEPPSGPISGSDYGILGTFDPNRESGGLLELNISDTVVMGDERVIAAGLDNSTYFFSSGVGGYTVGSFEINDGFAFGSDSRFGISIANYYYSGPPPSTEDQVFMGIGIAPTGSPIFAAWGDESNVDFQDITSGLGSNTDITMKLSINTSNQVTAMWDYGSDGSFDLTQANFANLDFNSGEYTGAFDASTVVPEPISSTLFIVGGATLGLRRFWKKRKTA